MITNNDPKTGFIILDKKRTISIETAVFNTYKINITLKQGIDEAVIGKEKFIPLANESNDSTE